MRYTKVKLLFWAILTVTIFSAVPISATVYYNEKLSLDAQKALQTLYAESESARTLGASAKAILVFPSIGKAGFIVGGHYGEGVLIKSGNVAGYYNTVSLSYGLQAGVQKYGYVMFLMTDAAVNYLAKSEGWELGTGPNIVVVDKGAAGSLSTSTGQSDIYAFFFSQQGLMAGLGLQGTKISRMKK